MRRLNIVINDLTKISARFVSPVSTLRCDVSEDRESTKNETMKATMIRKSLEIQIMRSAVRLWLPNGDRFHGLFLKRYSRSVKCALLFRSLRMLRLVWLPVISALLEWWLLYQLLFFCFFFLRSDDKDKRNSVGSTFQQVHWYCMCMWTRMIFRWTDTQWPACIELIESNCCENFIVFRLYILCVCDARGLNAHSHGLRRTRYEQCLKWTNNRSPIYSASRTFRYLLIIMRASSTINTDIRRVLRVPLSARPYMYVAWVSSTCWISFLQFIMCYSGRQWFIRIASIYILKLKQKPIRAGQVLEAKNCLEYSSTWRWEIACTNYGNWSILFMCEIAAISDFVRLFTSAIAGKSFIQIQPTHEHHMLEKGERCTLFQLESELLFAVLHFALWFSRCLELL